MKKELDNLLDIVDTLFNGVNNNQKSVGSGLFFSYNLRAEKKKEDDEEIVVYYFTIKLREAGHGERELQEFSFVKPKDLDTFNMKYQVLLSVLVNLIEMSLLQWNELGKLLNQDIEMQDAAKTVKHNG